MIININFLYTNFIMSAYTIYTKESKQIERQDQNEEEQALISPKTLNKSHFSDLETVSQLNEQSENISTSNT